MRTDFLKMIIGSEADGLTVKQFLRGRLHFSAHQVSRVKYRPEGITVNDAPQWVNAVLRAGDVLRIRLDDSQEPDTADPDEARCAASGPAPESPTSESFAPESSAPDIPVLYEDDFLLIADKPAGMVSHPSHGHHGDSALDILSASRGRLYLIGRLDKDTSGVLLFAKHMETAALLSRAKKAPSAEAAFVRKQYLARIRGVIDPPEGSIDTPIGTAREYPLKMQADPARGKAAVTHYRTVFSGNENGEAYSILSVTIDHGRTHQIRVHLSSVGHPLAGDALYGPASSGPKSAAGKCCFPGACLHASSLSLIHPYSGEAITVRAAEPDWCRGISAIDT